MENSPAQPAATTQEQPSVFAPSWEISTRNQPENTPPSRTSFEQQFSQSADRIAGELNLNTQQQPQQQAQVEPTDPLAESELEISPGKKFKRGEVAKKLIEAQELEKKYKHLESMSGTKLRQAAEAKKQADAVIAQAQRALQVEQELQKILASGDPDQLLRAVGYDPERVRQQAIERAYRDSQLSPEQKEIERLKSFEAENQRLRKVEEQRHQQIQQQQMMQQQEAATNQAAQNLSKAFTATAEQMKLPKSALTIQRFANLLAGAQARGLDPTFSDLGQAVHKQYVDDVVSFLDNIEPEEFIKHIPTKTQQRLRQFFLKQAGNAAAPTAQASGPQAPRQRQQKPMRISEYNSFIDTLRR